MRLILILCTALTYVSAIPFPNGLLGAPEIDCGEDAITVVFNTQDTFRGRVYAVGHVDDEDCFSDNTGRRTTSIVVPKAKCGVVSLRSDNPPGLFVNIKVMVNFHPLGMITKVDKGFEISCFYMEVDKTVTYPLTVSMKPLQPRTELAEMPRCRYEVLNEAGEPATVVAVGDKLKHRWICESNAPGLWCMTVHSCFVDDGSGTQIQILQNDGCARDKFLLDNLEYPDGPEGDLMAMKETHAFKFADRIIVNFQCSVRLDVKERQCTRKNCATLRRRRDIPWERIEETSSFALPPMAEVDVRSRQIDVLDPESDFGVSSEDPAFQSAVESVGSSRSGCRSPCAPFAVLFASTTLCGVFFLSTILSTALLWRSSRQKAWQ